MPLGRLRARALTLLTLITLLALSGCNGSFWATSPAPQPIGPGCPPWTAATPAPAAVAQPPSDPLALESYNARLVAQTAPPTRDMYTLAQRLVYQRTGHLDCQSPTSPPTREVGDDRKFWVINASQSGYRLISARLDYVTPHLYVYVQDGAPVNYLALKASADRFEAQTYNRDRAAFGEQWNLGPDHDPHVTLLNARGLGALGGYFSSVDEYPVGANGYSNTGQILYLNLSAQAPGTATYDATVAHEFQHLIHWWARPQDPSWANEGLSELAQRLNGLPTAQVERAYLNAPQTPLIGGWSGARHSGDSAAHDGAAYAFMDYFYQRYGGDAALRAYMSSDKPATQAFDQALARRGSKDRFDDVFRQFLLANLLNDPRIAGGAYAYTDFPGERARLTGHTSAYPFAPTTATLPEYGAAYYDLNASRTTQARPRTLNVTFSGAPLTSITPNTPYPGASDEWWSNSADNMDSTLTRTVDLTSAPLGPVTLTFDAWYNLEAGADYTYSEVSTDNGATWTPLPMTTSTTSDPNGENLGDGVTGVSGGGAQPQWTPETVDLTAYRGRRIQLRFETVTDDAVHLPGFTLDNLSIPAIGLADDMSADNGWTAQGWLRTNNVLPQRWMVNAVVFHPQQPPSIVPLSVDPTTGEARMTVIDFGGDVTHVELAIAPTAATTFVAAAYQIAATLD